MKQILYVSLSTAPDDTADLAGILEQSRHNNAIDGITGLLWSDGRSFLQAFEGPRASVDSTYARIVADERHHSLELLSRRYIVDREFGVWSMAHRRAGDAIDPFDVHMRRLLADASPGIRSHFGSLISTGRPIPVWPRPV